MTGKYGNTNLVLWQMAILAFTTLERLEVQCQRRVKIWHVMNTRYLAFSRRSQQYPGMVDL